MLSLRVNGKAYNLDVEPETPLLWVIRDTIGLTGTKFGCGMALCGACTVHLNGKPVRSCVTRVSQAAGQEITTIEGLSADAQHPAQIAWREGDVPECGYCQSGQIMAAAACSRRIPTRPTPIFNGKSPTFAAAVRTCVSVRRSTAQLNLQPNGDELTGGSDDSHSRNESQGIRSNDLRRWWGISARPLIS